MRLILAGLSFMFWTTVCLLFSIFILGSFWPGIAAIPGALILLVIALRKIKFMYGLWLVGTPTVFIYANNMLSSLPLLRVERAFLPLFFLNMLVGVSGRRITLKPLQTIEKAMLALLIISSISVVVASFGKSMEIVRQNAWFWLECLLMPYLAFYFARQQTWSERDVTLLFRWLLLAGLYLVVVGGLQLFLGMQFFYPKYLQPLLEYDGVTGVIEQRATGVFENPNEYGLVMTTLLVLVLFLFARCTDGMVRTLYLLVMAALLVGLAICKTRAPWAGAMAGLLIIYVGDRRVRWPLLAGAIIAVVGFLVALPYLISSGLLQFRILDFDPLYARLAAYTTALNMILHNPLTGLGFGPFTFAAAKPDYATTFGLIFSQYQAGVPHNEFLHMLVLLGLSGFVPFIVLLYWAFRLTSASTLRSGGAPSWQVEFAIYARAVLVGYVCTAMLVDVLFFHYFMMLMYFILGISASSFQPHYLDSRRSQPALPVAPST